MKLKEIYDRLPTLTMGKTPTRSRGHDTGLMTKNLGAGSYGYVRNNPVDAHLVAKRSISGDKLDNDGYYQYVQYIVKNNLAESNIHFPRIYNITLTPTLMSNSYHFRNMNDLQRDMFGKPSGEHLYRVDMERLIDYKEVTKDEMKALIRYTIHSSDFISLELDRDMGSVLDLYNNYIIHNIRGYYGHTVDASVFKDKSLVEAMNIVAKLVATRKKTVKGARFWVDTKAANYLFRRTSVGIQIVISDPLA